MTQETTTSFDEIAAREDEFQLATYKKFPFAVERGSGSWVETSEGERYLDLYGGHAVAATGHSHPRVVAALAEQAGRLLFYSNLVYSGVRARASERLVGVAPEGITKAFFCNSGTEANENAMRMARMRTGRESVITFTGGFHGRTADSISATFLGKYRDLGKPNVPGHLCAEFGSIESVESLADETVAAVMLEPVQSMSGVRVAPPEFYSSLRKLCDERGMLLIYDEVQTGMGRTGSWFFAGSEAGAGIVPDIITLAKALGSGVPVGACLTTEEVAGSIKENDLGTTFGGGMLAMAAVVATLEAIEADGMLANARAVEGFLRESLAGVPGVRGLRGVGLLLGVEFEDAVAAKAQKALLERRIITGTSSDPKVLRLLPPLCLTVEEAGLFVDALKAAKLD
ncbi:MAG TPA: aminotransferase class III-fold pyridoxal phosphate-dependent enzyme [Pyrinomonadaceae bacterium]|jgi:acetylornithine aminotransferase/acetylornithine/N-succinyldiaminopimelate aminotransferase|nr:aminotransferase class III-fold pyridoxal phosphate-dependent enzyme [Pyrinomonadaceae bacterium]